MSAPSKKRTRRGTRSGERADAYQLVTDRIIEALEAGVVPWHRPWRTAGAGNVSLSTGRGYRGVNVIVLTATAAARGYTSRWWGTFNQIKERGGQVRAGEKGTPVVYWNFFEKTNSDGEVTDRIPFLRHFTVFNADQADGLVVPADDEPLAEHEPIEAAEAAAYGYWVHGGAQVKHGGNRAAYSPALDLIQLPPLGQFETAEHYYGTLFHECVHSTGHSSRLARPGVVDAQPFGSPDYSREELVAELGAAFVCGEVGIPVNVQHHAGYVASWIAALRGDNKLIVQAAAAAQKSADLILRRSQGQDEEAT